MSFKVLTIPPIHTFKGLASGHDLRVTEVRIDRTYESWVEGQPGQRLSALLIQNCIRKLGNTLPVGLAFDGSLAVKTGQGEFWLPHFLFVLGLEGDGGKDGDLRSARVLFLSDSPELNYREFEEAFRKHIDWESLSLEWSAGDL